ncbi:MAG: hypothetical protein OEV87_11775 [Phycisphaerae bacterium]|nr:hypothetical protein [Phycisphaerae bacterium]
MSKTKPAPEVRLQPIEDVIRERQDLCIEAAQCGVYAYAYGGVDALLIGEAVMRALESPAETVAAICEKLEGRCISPEQLDDCIRHCFFLYGIYQSFLARSAGKYRKE